MAEIGWACTNLSVIAPNGDKFTINGATDSECGIVSEFKFQEEKS